IESNVIENPDPNHPLLIERLEEAIKQLQQAPSFSKPTKAGRLFDIVKRVLHADDGFKLITQYIDRIEQAGAFDNSDYAKPQILIPALSAPALLSNDVYTVIIETLSELRFLAVAKQDFVHPEISSEQAHHFLTQVL
ncbi:MAG TPA: hypothetical protein DEQ60_06325, partial [Methylophaga sp.]|nr:hypothetical protein [Methylophaga sp.]